MITRLFPSSPPPSPSVRLTWVAADQCALLALLVQERSEDTSPVARVSSLDSSRAQYGSLTGQHPDVVLGLASAEQPITLPTISQEQLLDD